MKISAQHFEEIRAAIAPLDTEERRTAYRAGDFPRAARVQDLNKRYRWDLFWAAGVSPQYHLEGLTDVHIDTALRSIVRVL